MKREMGFDHTLDLLRPVVASRGHPRVPHDLVSVLRLRGQRGTPLLVRRGELIGIENIVDRKRSAVLRCSRPLAVAQIHFLLLVIVLFNIVLDSPQFSRVLLLVRDQGFDAETSIRLHRLLRVTLCSRRKVRFRCADVPGGWPVLLLLLLEYTTRLTVY